MDSMIYAVPAAGILALVFAFIKATWVNKQDGGDDTMKKIAALIRAGAMAFLAREYKVLALFGAIVAVLLAVSAQSTGGSPLVALSFVVGAVASGLTSITAETRPPRFQI